MSADSLRIKVVGAGPAGLLFALLMARQSGVTSGHTIDVFEQNPPDSTYGWGVVFSGRALGFLEQLVPDVYADLQPMLERWSDITLVHRDTPVAVDGSEFSGIARIALLKVLIRHCTDAGVRVHFNHRIDSDSNNEPTHDKYYDLVVGADGVNSVVRDAQSGFGTQRQSVTNHYIWYGTTRVFDTLSLIFREYRSGAFVAHTYRYSPTMSTFLVECDEATFRESGLADMSSTESMALCESVFKADLHGESLQSNQSQWRQFLMVENREWFVGNCVLLGDALRTVHFSIGSGTRTAMEDAIALAESFTLCANEVKPALEKFVADRQASARKLLAIAAASIDWYEDYRSAMHLDPYEFAMNYMTRGGRVDIEQLRERAPRFVSAYTQHRRLGKSGAT